MDARSKGFIDTLLMGSETPKVEPLAGPPATLVK